MKDTSHTASGNKKSWISSLRLRERQHLFFIIPAFFVILSIGAIATWGLKPGIDLAGGSMLQVRYEERPSAEAVNASVASLDYGEIRIQASNEQDYILRQRELLPAEKDALMDALSTLGALEEVQFNSVGPSIGSEIVRKAWWAFGFVTLSIILFIAFALRHVSKPVSSWKYGIVAIVTLVHDVLIPAGLFAYLGHVQGAEVGVFFIVAVLATLGISINDTIVVFDRIRENLKLNEEKHQGKKFGDIVWSSVMQTLARSINTSFTVVIMLFALFVFGPESTKDFSLTLMVGMIAGTYSSVFLASPLLVLIEKRQPVVKEDGVKEDVIKV
jgi:preprotein translocase subunit SecF